MKDKAAAGILAIFLGAYGAHHFYLGDKDKGLTYLLISLLTFGVGAIVLGIIGIVEGIRILCMSEEEFARYAGEDEPENEYTKKVSPERENGYLQRMEELKKAKELWDDGVITEQDYIVIKTKLLGE